MGDSGKALPEPRSEPKLGVGLVHITCKTSKVTRRMEGRDQPEGSLREKARVRTQSRVALPPNLRPPKPGSRPAALFDEDALLRAFRRQKRLASAAVDGVTMAKYQELTDNHRDLCAQVHTGGYRPQPVRRVYVRKSRSP